LIADKLGRQFPAVEQMLREAQADILAFAAFPAALWRRMWSTNPLERVIKEVKRRADVVAILPDEAAILGLTGAVLIEAYDEWAIAERATSQKDRWPPSWPPPAASSATPALHAS
jgi:putative transposase